MRLKYLVVVFVIAVFLRSVNLELIPRWHWDEAANLDITANLLSGRAQVFALKYPFFPHPPLFFVFAAPFIKLLGASNLSLRVFAATLSTATAVVVYLTTSRIFDDKKHWSRGYCTQSTLSCSTGAEWAW